MVLFLIQGKLNRKYTKIMQNSVKAKMKRSQLERKMSYFVFLSFLIQIFCCFFASLYHVIYLNVYKDDFSNWIDFATTNMFVLFLIRAGNWLLIFG